jgi:hypothetical protein
LKKIVFLIDILFILSIWGCRNDVPPDNEVKKRMIQYLQSINMPLKIDKITVLFGKYNVDGGYQPAKVYVKGKILSENKRSIDHMINNIYDARFYQIFYSNWEGNFSLERKPPPDSIIYLLSSKNFDVEKDQVKILKVGSMNEMEKFYPVDISIPSNNLKNNYKLKFSENEFGIWEIGINKLLTPEGTIESFLSEVNRGKTEKAKRYFSYQYKYGYDDDDKNNLEKLFPKGSINDISFTNIYTKDDTASVYLIVAKTDLDTFKTNLTLIKFGYEWRIKYYGWDWKFKKGSRY